MEISQATLNSLGITVFGSAASFIAAWFWYARGIANKKADILELANAGALSRISELETKVRLAEMATTPIVTAFQALLVKQLTHAGTPEMDALMVKVGPPDILTPEERARLIVLLVERTHDFTVEITESERDAAIIMPIVMKMAKDEQAKLAEVDAAHDLKLVTIVSVVGTSEAKPDQQKDE